MKKIANALICVSLLAGAAAQAQGLTIGGSLAGTRYKGDNVGGLATDRSDKGGKLYGGYWFSPNLGVEAGYARLGNFDSAAGRVKNDGYFADVVGALPLASNFSLLGRVGAFNGKSDSSLSGRERGTNLKVGAGLQYDIDKNLGVRGEWERYRFDQAGGGKANADMYSLGLNYKF